MTSKYHFEVEERSIYKFNIEANDRDQAIRIFINNASLYMKDDTLENIHLDYEVTE
jgi:hypothetical protein